MYDRGRRSRSTTYDRDKESGLDYAMARMYANTGGRFTSPDPADPALEVPQSLNRYLYGLNDPINYTDPDGEFSIFGGIGGFFKALGKVLGIVRPIAPAMSAVIGGSVFGNEFQSEQVKPDKKWESIRLAEIAAWLAAINSQKSKAGDPYKLVVTKDCYLRGGSRAMGDVGLAPSVARVREYTLVDINDRAVYGVNIREINHVYGTNGLKSGNATFTNGVMGARAEDIISTDQVVRQDQMFYTVGTNIKLLIQEMDGRISPSNAIYSDRNVVVVNGNPNFVNGGPKFCP